MYIHADCVSKLADDTLEPGFLASLCLSNVFYNKTTVSLHVKKNTKNNVKTSKTLFVLNDWNLPLYS